MVAIQSVIIFTFGFSLFTLSTGRGNTRFDKVVDTKIESSIRKVKKEMKKEFRSRIIPKVVRLVLKDMEKDDESQIIEKLAYDFQILETKIDIITKKVEALEKDNLILKQTLTTSNKHFITSSAFSEFIENLNTSCQCRNNSFNIKSNAEDINLNIEYLKANKSTKEHLQIEKEILPLGISVKSNAMPSTTSVPMAYIATATLNVSLKMPDFTNQDSLLIVDDSGRMNRVTLVDSDVKGRMRTEKHVECIAYDPVSKKLFWSRNQPKFTDVNEIYNVFSSNLDGSDITTLLGGKWIFSIAVDGETQQIFMSAWTSHHVSVMSTSGGNYQIVRGDFNVTGSPKNVLLDTRAKKVYVSFSSYIFSMDYDGRNLRQLIRGVWIKPMALDSISNVLYYSDKSNLYSFNLEYQHTMLVYQMKGSVNSFVLYHDVLYIAYQKSNVDVDVLSLNNKSVRSFTFMKGEWFRLCLIPA